MTWRKPKAASKPVNVAARTGSAAFMQTWRLDRSKRPRSRMLRRHSRYAKSGPAVNVDRPQPPGDVAQVGRQQNEPRAQGKWRQRHQRQAHVVVGGQPAHED